MIDFSDDGDLVWRYAPEKIVPVDICPIQSYTDEIISDFIKPFALHNELMYRCRIYTTDEEVIFAMDTHHIISDGTMTANFAEALFAAYRGEPLKEDHYYYYLETVRRHCSELEQTADLPVPLIINYDSELYSRTLIEKFASCFNEALDGLVAGEI
ncbi:MAG: hypothetical protein IKE58_10455 [Blautia sp.]|nr:hypothetical protein [Blautia sp.]